MLAIEITISILPLTGLMLTAFAVGFLLRGSQLKSSRRKILELEKEMLSNHADILELQKERAIMTKQMRESKIPVIPMNSPKEDSDKSRHAR
jgi:hypothetical protein